MPKCTTMHKEPLQSPRKNRGDNQNEIGWAKQILILCRYCLRGTSIHFCGCCNWIFAIQKMGISSRFVQQKLLVLLKLWWQTLETLIWQWYLTNAFIHFTLCLSFQFLIQIIFVKWQPISTLYQWMTKLTSALIFVSYCYHLI